MRRLFIFSSSLLCFVIALQFSAVRQNTVLAAFQDQSTRTGKPELLADDWVKRLNALSDWYLSPDGKEEGVEALVDKMMELYSPDVLAELPPHDPDQIGPVMLRGSANLRKYFDRIARTRVRLLYMAKRQTAGPGGEYEGERLVYSKALPWGGMGMSFQIISVYSLRENRKRYMAPGAVFIQTGEDGKINRIRLLEAEVTEVVPM